MESPTTVGQCVRLRGALILGDIGTQTYISLLTGREPRLTVYLAAQAYRRGGVAPPSTTVFDQDPMSLIDRFERRDPITNHPFLRRLRREPVYLPHLWLLLANFQISISKEFARWLAIIVARVNDDRIRCILAAQLNDELGNGELGARSRRAVLGHDGTLGAIPPRGVPPWNVARTNARAAAPSIYGSHDTGGGRRMAGEIFGKQMDQYLAREFRRQALVEPESLVWLQLHETLEATHADSSGVLAQLVPPEAAEAARRGAVGVYLAGWAFLDELYGLCFCASLKLSGAVFTRGSVHSSGSVSARQ
jgi:hypothetical protein